jgi:excinuclease ABC subunit C
MNATLPPADSHSAAPLEKLKIQMQSFPHQAGVYLLRDISGKVLYVGKAKDLRNRVLSYLKASGIKTLKLMDRAETIECILTENEKEALILESNLIKKYRPRYNVDLRDDKRYPCLRLDPKETFPRLQVVRKIRNDGAVYLGPFSAAGKMRATLFMIQQVFPLRQCRQKELPRRSRPCLYYQTGRCPGPCRDKISSEEYRRRVEGIIQFFQGHNSNLTRDLKQRMKEASDAFRFEEAAVLRDQIRAISETLKEQHVVSSRLEQADVLALVESAEAIAAAILFIRFGSVAGMTRFLFRDPSQPQEEVLADLITQYYRKDRYLPPRIFVPFPFEDRVLLEEILSEQKGEKVRLVVPQRGEARHWLEMAEENARGALQGKEADQNFLETIAAPLQERLALNRRPNRVGALDISNLQGLQAVGSWVVFHQGLPEKSRYRRFRIRTVEQPNDYAMMAEMIGRLIRHPEEIPDLILIDGGKGQLTILKDIFDSLPEKQRPDLAAIAKKTFVASGGKDGIYLPGRKNPVKLRLDSPVLHFLQRVRDEAHRFALSYHHLLRKKEIRQAQSAKR